MHSRCGTGDDAVLWHKLVAGSDAGDRLGCGCLWTMEFWRCGGKHAANRARQNALPSHLSIAEQEAAAFEDVRSTRLSRTSSGFHQV
jgi:hypothetical protein